MDLINRLTSITADGETYPVIQVYLGVNYQRKKIIVPAHTTILEIFTAFGVKFINHWTIPSINGDVIHIEDLVRPLSDFNVGNWCFLCVMRKAFNV